MEIFLFFVFICMIFKFNATNIYNNNNLKNKKKNLILSVIINYDWKKIAPFFISFKKARFNNCDCVIFIKNLKQETINKIEFFNVKTIKMQSSIKSRIINYRWKLYEDYLRNNTGKYKFVLCIDVRDSFFQKDIFKYYGNIKSFLSFALEDSYLTEKVNRRWIIKAFGYKVYNSIKHERIICGGTILGSLDKIIELSSSIWKIMNQSDDSRLKWIDQSVINYLIYYKKLFSNETIFMNENKDSPFLTLGISRPEIFIIDYKDNILNIKSEIPAVIHQYDRHKKILTKVLKKYSNNSTEENDDKNSIGYRNYINLSLVNISKKIKIQKGYNNIYLRKNLFLKLYSIFLLYILIVLIIVLYKFKTKSTKCIYKFKKNNLSYNQINMEN